MKNKKNKIIIITILLSLIIMIILGMIVLTTKKVDKLSNVKIENQYGKEITNYNENKMPFIIKKTDEKQKIYVDGKKMKDNERIYKVGKHEIKVVNGLKKEKCEINIKQVKRENGHIYNIYVIQETLPTLLASLNLSTNLNQKGFLWTARTSTVDLDKIKESFPNIYISKYKGKIHPDVFKEELIPEIKEYIKTILEKDEDAYFDLYIQEDNFYLETELFGKIGLNDSRYNVNMYTNGTLGYTRKYEIKEENKYERYLKEKKDYFNIIEKIKSNTWQGNDFPGSYMVEKNNKYYTISYNLDYMLISTLRKNITLLMQYPEFHKFEDEQIASEMEKANVKKIIAQDEFNKLDENSKKLFFNIINLDKKDLDNKYFTEKDGKYLVITGTVPFYEKHKKEDFEKIVTKIAEDYGKEYILLYKPHPRAIPNKEQEEFLNKLNIKVLPGRLPMEAITFVYPNLKLGGFGSSLYMSADKGKTLFFIAKDKNELVEPLNELSESIFKNTKFYN